MTSDLRYPFSVLRRLRLCFIAGTLGQGGAERQLYYLLKSLKAAGSEVTLLSLTRGEYWEKLIRDLGVPVIWVGQSQSRLTRLARIVREVRKLRPNVLQSQHFYTNTYTALTARMTGCRDIGAVRNNGLSEIFSGGPIFGRLHLRLPRLLAANSDAAIRNLRSVGVPERRLFHLPNVVDSSSFSPGPDRFSGHCIVLGVGRLVPQKRFDRFLDILAAVRCRGHRVVRGIIAGDGPLRGELQMRAASLGFSATEVRFVGSAADVGRFYHEADVLLLTSDYEGTPNVVMEAMACGLPVVAANVGGVSALVKNGETGFLFEPGDTAGALVALERLACEPALAGEIGRRARAFIEKHRSSDLLPEILTVLYEKVLAAE